MENKDLRVLFLPRGTKDTASSRIRVFNVVPHLEERGITSVIVDKQRYRNRDGFLEWIIGLSSYFSSLLFRALMVDIIYIQKQTYAYPFRLFFKYCPAEVIYDFDDAVFAVHSWKDYDDAKSEAEANEAALHSMFRLATAVVAGSPSLGRYARNHHENVYVIRPSLPRDKYRSDRVVRHSNQENDSVVIGWIGNPQNLYYLNHIREPLRQVLDANPHCKLHVISSEPFVLDNYEDQIEFIRWSSDTEVESLRQFDIAIRPMTKDEYAQKKGGLVSVLQCMALGLPVIITPVECARDLIEGEETGVFADSPEEWTQQLQRLIDSPEQRIAIGNRARQKIENEYFVDDRAAEYIDLFQQCID